MSSQQPQTLVYAIWLISVFILFSFLGALLYGLSGSVYIVALGGAVLPCWGAISYPTRLRTWIRPFIAFGFSQAMMRVILVFSACMLLVSAFIPMVFSTIIVSSIWSVLISLLAIFTLSKTGEELLKAFPVRQVFLMLVTVSWVGMIWFPLVTALFQHSGT
ncbi:hypothetical protein PN462_06125 [Spirulina sp. CS-785/01]|uniref:hypothetical protein n=1 Tax=Spirulina sp. CS-785/01 TaxID=3021716 RepID=UPI00232C00D9|nr:hypothetical protein [Spirulina sp. CS-785/01]MDB9312671.1 hypothetical protein [Spirulina sp. CS-785/01]